MFRSSHYTVGGTVKTKFIVGAQPTGWYFPGELTERARLEEVSNDSLLDEDELAAEIEAGLQVTESAANGGPVPLDTAPVDTVDVPPSVFKRP